MYMQEELDGMHAGLIWVRRTGQLAWGRDRAGEKSLSEGQLGPLTFTFASGVCGHSRLHFERFSDAMSGIVPYNTIEWLRSGASPDSCTAHASEIPPCSFQVFPFPPLHGARDSNSVPVDDQQSAKRHLTLPEERGVIQWLGSVTATSFIESAVRSRLEADVPLGLFLSGGLDSALIAAIAHKTRPDIRAFTVRMPHPEYDESDAAAKTAAAIGIEHSILECQPEPAVDLVHLIEQLGLPFGDSSLLPTYWVSNAAREHVKVALSGDGGDELFGGYRRHTINSTLNRWHHLLRFIPDRLLNQRNPKGRGSYLARLSVAARYGGYNELLSIFPTPDLRRLVKTNDNDLPDYDSFRRVDDPLRHDFLNYLPDDILCKTDTASMSVGLEVRAPFLARELVEAAMRTPLDILMPNGERKGLLKQVARKYLPPKIVDRPKQGFAIPIGEWFRTDYGGMRQLLYDYLESADPFPGLGEAGVEINMGFVRQMLLEHDAAGEKSLNPWHGRDHSQRLYMLLVLSIWAKWLAGIRGDD